MTPRPHRRDAPEAHDRGGPGSAMLHPAVVVAVGVFVANDHVLKAHWPGVVSGKLSDIAGLLFFPLFLQAVIETGQALLGRWRRPSRRLLVSCVVATGTVFALIQLSPTAGEAWRILWGWLQWPLQSGFPHTAPIPVTLTPDPTDLLVLPVLVLPWMIGRRRTPPNTSPSRATC